MHRPDYLKDLFSVFGVEPTISGWTILFTEDETEELFDVMGDPVRGMEDKWL